MIRLFKGDISGADKLGVSSDDTKPLDLTKVLIYFKVFVSVSGSRADLTKV